MKTSTHVLGSPWLVVRSLVAWAWANGPAVLVLAGLAAAWGGMRWAAKLSTEHGVPETAAVSITEPVVAERVILTEAQRRNFPLEVVTVDRQELQHEHIVPGRIAYDESRHIDVSTPVEGILQALYVKPGDRVAAQQKLFIVHSPEVGRARADVLNRRAQVDLAREQYERDNAVATALKDLLQSLDRSQSIRDIEAEFVDRPLGAHRSALLAAYARWQLAEGSHDSLRPLAGTGSVSTRTVRERESDLHIARAEFQAIREQAEFTARMAMHKSQAELADAQRLWANAQQYLSTLIGAPEVPAAVGQSDRLAELEMHAPFAGTIESVAKAQSERLTASTSVLVLADTTRLYVSAEIRETDWPALNIQPHTEFLFSIPALEDRTFSARLHYVGREVNRQTNALPLVGLVDNTDGLLRPGMFARITLPIGAAQQVLAVPAAAIAQYDRREFVFVARPDGDFEKRSVVTGMQSAGWVEVRRGLAAGERIVADGAFLLKSALLMEGESAD